jgi:hypothetical protein
MCTVDDNLPGWPGATSGGIAFLISRHQGFVSPFVVPFQDPALLSVGVPVFSRIVS